MSAIRRRLAIRSALALSAVLISAHAVFAQAWVPERGEGAVTLAVQEMNVKKHLATTTIVDGGHINTIVFLTDATYGLTDKIAVDLAVPVVSSTYAGLRPHPGTNIDNGKFHTTVTDLRFSVRYNINRKGAVFTPFIGSVVPSHDYAYYGHSAAGQRLHELQVGTFVAKLFTSGVPGMFVSGRVGYAFVEKVQDISHNKSIGDLEVGYFVTPAFRTFAIASGQYTHGGIDFPINGQAGLPAPLRSVHDIIQRVHSLTTGGGFAYSINDSTDMFASFTREVAGRNGHVLNRMVTVGASWSFTRRGKGKIAEQQEASLGRCICQKSGT